MTPAQNHQRKTPPPAKELATYRVAQELGGIELLNAHYHRQNFSRHSHEG